MNPIAKILLYDAEDTILLLRRSATHPHFAHDVDLPGGEVEPGEQGIEAVVREVYEETGMIVPPEKVRLVYELAGEREQRLYFAQLDETQPSVTLSWEHEAYEWVPQQVVYSDRPARDGYMKIVHEFLSHRLHRSIEVIHDLSDIKLQKSLLSELEKYYDEVRTCLPMLPPSIQIYFDNWHLIPEHGVGGYAYSADIMTLSFDLAYADKAKQLAYLRETVFHEGLHIAQGFTGEAEPVGALDSALYEGMAVVFERDIASAQPPFGEYKNIPTETLEAWCAELATISATDYRANDGELWQRWAFYDEASGERWRLYKVGTWLVDRYLATTKTDAAALVGCTPHHIRRVLHLG